MIDIKSENKAFYWSTVFLRSLYHAGVKHIVISPGSRSTPLTMAAAAFPAIEKNIILDERSAAFFALGIGKATNQPAALICTSGTAVANYYPAVVEARMSGVPLLLLTADRPPNLVQAGANQAINQHHIFGDYPVLFEDVGAPELQKSDFEELKRLAQQAVYTTHDKQGPAHLNFPFKKPLEPKISFVQSIRKENETIVSKKTAPARQTKEERFQFNDEIIEVVNKATAPLIIVGQLAPASNLNSIFSFAEKLGAPVLSEQGNSNLDYSIQGFEGFLRNDDIKQQLSPDLILRFGRQPASKSLLQAITFWNPNRHIYVADTKNRSDIAHTNTDSLEWNGSVFETRKIISKSDSWLKKWKNKEEKYFNKESGCIGNQTSLTDGHIYHHFAPAIPKDWFIFISNSFSARDHSMFGRWKTQPLFTNRGASGIDGITSTAMGISTTLNQPGILFTGDLAFLHDTNALLNAEKLSHPLVVVVINNNGGSIFRMLPIADHSEYFTSYFETPQQADITALAKSYGVYSKTISTVNELQNIDLESIVSKSISKLCVLECQTNADASMDLRNTLWNIEL